MVIIKQNWFKVAIVCLLTAGLVYFGAINMYTYRFEETGVIRINKLSQKSSVLFYEESEKGWQYSK